MKNSGSKNSAKAEAMFARAHGLHQQGNLDDAQKLYRKILELDKNHINALNLLAAIYLDRQALREAASLLRKSLALMPSQASALCNLGLCAEKLGDNTEAMACYNRAVQLQPGFAGVLYNRAALLRKLQQPEAALQDYNAVLALQPEFFQAYNNKGNVLTDLSCLDDAVSCFNDALRVKPDYADAYNNRGVCYWTMRRLPEALADYRRAIALKPDYFTAHFNLATALCETRQFIAARHAVHDALVLQPDNAEALALALEIAMRLCDWQDFDRRLQQLAARVQAGDIAKPFTVITCLDNPALQWRAAQTWMQAWYPPSPRRDRSPGKSSDRIGVAYLSADFHEHATAQLMARVFELHDRSQFAVHAISIGPDRQDAMRQRLVAAFECFLDASSLPDAAIVQYIREHHIDILVDLKGYTQGNRARILAAHAAPLQVSYLGYPGTMGAPYMDYIIADNVVLPETLYPFFSETVIAVPGSYQCNDALRQIDQVMPDRAAQGLPAQGFVFCCFNQHYKFTPGVFAIWMRLLQQVPGSVLWLYVTEETAKQNLRATAQQQGVDADRLVFAGHLPLPQHLARMQLADLFLDTLPCNAHTTASDALWAGLPLLTCEGQSFAARVASSLLHALDLPELVTDSLAAYEARALALATDAAALTAIRQKLLVQKNTSSLFDSEACVRKLEHAYRTLWTGFIA
ncbi:MAG TPA: tetratricopeptide repeat protein [Pseudomonadales bacterium]|nr:tetratricopeptide repeat protein [Pseudomonadales bacterium]